MMVNNNFRYFGKISRVTVWDSLVPTLEDCTKPHRPNGWKGKVISSNSSCEIYYFGTWLTLKRSLAALIIILYYSDYNRGSLNDDPVYCL